MISAALGMPITGDTLGHPRYGRRTAIQAGAVGLLGLCVGELALLRTMASVPGRA